MFEPFLAALVTVQAQRLQLTIPEFDRIVVMRLDMVRDTCRDDLAFAQAHRTKRLVLKLTARPAMPRGFVVQRNPAPWAKSNSPCRRSAPLKSCCASAFLIWRPSRSSLSRRI